MKPLIIGHTEADDEDDECCEEFDDMGSYNHSFLQAKLAALFFSMDKYVALTELSLDIGGLDTGELHIRLKDHIKPDVCIYPERKMNLTHDILKMSEMPLLAIEILSPVQGVQTVLDKFKVYFELGIKSCWLVYPSAATVAVYSSADAFKVFNTGDIIDEVLNIQLPVSEIFGSGVQK